MVVIYPPDARVPIYIGDVTVWVSILTVMQKSNLLDLTKNEAGEQKTDKYAFAFALLKYCVKEIEGLVYFDGSKYELKFDKDGNLSDDSVNELFQMDQSNKLILAASHLFSKIEDLESEGLKIEVKNARLATSKKN